jgi:hypothetical protein
MRKKYHIIVNAREKPNVENTLKTLKRNYELDAVKGNTEKVGYTVNLSKYELLLLRLSCQSGKVIRVDNELTQ